MPTAVLAVDVRFSEDALIVRLSDGRDVSVPLEWFPRLRDASAEQRDDWRLIARGIGIHWDAVDEDIVVSTLLRATEPDPHEPTDPNGKVFNLLGDFRRATLYIESTINNFYRYFDEVGIVSAPLIAIIVLQIAIYACALILYRLSANKGAVALLGVYCFCGCFPLFFGFPALIGFNRGLLLRSRQLTVLGAIAGLLSIGAYIIGAANVAAVIVQEKIIPTPTPFVKVGSYPIQDVESNATPGLVLWDLSHGVGYRPPEVFQSSLIEYLNNKGYQIDFTNAGLLNLDISGYSLIILSVGCCAESSQYSYEEATRLFDYVDAGGGLLLLGEHHQVETGQSLDVVGNMFGIDLFNPPYYDGVSYFADHPVTSGIKSLQLSGAGTIIVSPPAVGVAWNSSSVALAVAEIGKGKVVAVGDSNFVDNMFFENNEKIFILNVVNWLTLQ